MSKVGIMGGTFNPMHNGHIEMAKEAMAQFELDKVLFITSGNPPHKQHEGILDGTIRHRMTELAVSGIDGFEAINYEVGLTTYSYTAKTLSYLKRKRRKDEYYLIIGADSLNTFVDWYKPEKILSSCVLLVYPREGFSIDKDDKISVSYTHLRRRRCRLQT